MKETVIDIIDSNFIMFRTRKFKSDMEYISCLGRVSGEIMKIFFYANCGNSTIEVFKKDRYKKNKGV